MGLDLPQCNKIFQRPSPGAVFIADLFPVRSPLDIKEAWLTIEHRNEPINGITIYTKLCWIKMSYTFMKLYMTADRSGSLNINSQDKINSQ